MRYFLYVSFAVSLIIIVGSYGKSPIPAPETVVGNPLEQGSGYTFPFNVIAGTIIVFIFYWIKFGQWTGPAEAPLGYRPKPTRHFTTWLRYSGWAGIYAFFMVLIFAICIYMPGFVTSILQAIIDFEVPQLSGTHSPIKKFIEVLSQNEPGPIAPYALIFVTLVWAGAFGEWEKAIRKKLQESALIPLEAKRLIDAFQNKTEYFSPNDEVIDRIIDALPTGILNRADINNNNNRRQTIFLQCENILHRFDDLAGNRVFAKIKKRYEVEYNDAKENLDQIREDLSEYRKEQIVFLTNNHKDKQKESYDDLSLMKIEEARKNIDSPDDFETKYFKEKESMIKKNIDVCFIKILHIVVCGVLTVGKTVPQRKALFDNFDLKMPPEIGPEFSTEWAWRAALTLAASVFSCSVVYLLVTRFFLPEAQASSDVCSPYSAAVPKGFGEAALWTFYATLMHLLGIIGGYLMQKSVMVSRQQIFNGGEKELKLSDLAECAALGFCLNIFLFIVILFSRGQLDTFRYTWHWAFIPAITAGFMGYYIVRSCESNSGKFKWALIQGAATGVAAVFVFFGIHDIRFLMELENCRSLCIYFIYCVITTLILGTALGVILQEWICRTKPALIEQD